MSRLFLHDKLRVFISSTIQECADERIATRKVIENLEYQPMFFEGAGARPHPPREVYLRLLSESQLFVGIYKNSYGWIADDMDISGVEDELRFAKTRGMPMLLFVHTDSSRRDERLQALLNEMLPIVTVGWFSDEEELANKVRRSIQAHVSSLYASSETTLGLPTEPAALVESLLPVATHRVERHAVETRLVACVDANPVTVVGGAMGIGKTILLAQVSARNSWLFVNGRELTPQELIGAMANALRSLKGAPAAAFVDVDNARHFLRSAWQEAEDFTLVVDGCDDVELVRQVVLESGGGGVRKRVVLSTRTGPGVGGYADFLIPPFDAEEAGVFVSAALGRAPDNVELSRLMRLSDGNPMYLRLYCAAAEQSVVSGIRELEIHRWNSLPRETREILSYAVVAGRPLTLDELRQLYDPQIGIEAVREILADGAHVIRAWRGSIEIFHSHFRDTVLRQIAAEQALHAHYAHRLSDFLLTIDDPVGAYVVLSSAQQGAPRTVMRKAAFRALALGDVRRGRIVLRDVVRSSLDRGDSEDAALTLLNLARLEQLGGDQAAVEQALSDAEQLREACKDEYVRNLVTESALLRRAWNHPTSEIINELRKIHETYEKNGDDFQSARLLVDLSALSIRSDDFRGAFDAAVKAIDVLRAHGDEFGVATAKANLLAAASGLPEEEETASRLLDEMNEMLEGDKEIRMRALLCNVLTRRSRERGEFDAAIDYATEAIDICRRLGDEAAVAVNQVNRGNALRQRGDVEKAMVDYEEVSAWASKSGDRKIDADVNRIVASVYNDNQDHERARIHAEYSIGLTRDTESHLDLALAYEELGGALQGLGKLDEASDSYLEGAIAVRAMPEHNDLFSRLLMLANVIMVDQGRYVAACMGMHRVCLQDNQGSTELASVREAREWLYKNISEIIEHLTADRSMTVLGPLFRGALDTLPGPVRTATVLRLSDAIVASDVPRSGWDRSLLALAVLLSSATESPCSMDDIVHLAEKVSRKVDGVNFKPHPDGAHHWVIEIHAGQVIRVSIDQLDDRSETAIVTAAIVFLLKAIERNFRTEILPMTELPRSEIYIYIHNVNELRDSIDLGAIGAELPLKDGFGVTRVAHPGESDQSPTVVLIDDSLYGDMALGSGQANRLHRLIANLIREMSYQLLNGEVDFDALRAPVMTALRRAIS